ncbi:MAG: DUF3567 family protein [Rhodocyclaceae bacterium]|nr:DUF3567 family protein [Rhodocyclaceae bacterium]MBX3669439.1 DUF3567 family protein [Rhodocyclaceae bacterium]
MQIVFNDASLYVVDYPAQEAIEVIDKRSGRGAFIRDDAARRFRADLNSFVEAGEPDALDEFIGHYIALMHQPAIYH